MARYIDADAAIEYLEKHKEIAKKNCFILSANEDSIIKFLQEKCPTADVVEVDKVAEMFAEQFGNKCPCNFNDNDEWLTLYCDYTNTCDCPCKDGWKQFIKHYDKRKEQ